MKGIESYKFKSFRGDTHLVMVDRYYTCRVVEHYQEFDDPAPVFQKESIVITRKGNPREAHQTEILAGKYTGFEKACMVDSFRMRLPEEGSEKRPLLIKAVETGNYDAEYTYHIEREEKNYG